MSLRSDLDSNLEIPLAFIVDGDNASAKLVGEMLAEASKYGSAIIRRVYGDWTSPQMSSWRETLHDFALHPIQQFANVSGKNATDSAMIIDAMDIMHGGLVKGFCIVSSDSDYTRLATRIREAGLFVMGIGVLQTPAAFQRACNIFVFSENLVSPSGATVMGAPGRKEVGQGTLRARLAPTEALRIVQQAFDNLDRGDGIVHLATLGAALYRLDPAFDPRTYGKPKLLDLIQSLAGQFTIKRPTGPESGAVYVKRLKIPQ